MLQAFRTLSEAQQWAWDNRATVPFSVRVGRRAYSRQLVIRKGGAIASAWRPSSSSAYLVMGTKPTV